MWKNVTVPVKGTCKLTVSTRSSNRDSLILKLKTLKFLDPRIEDGISRFKKQEVFQYANLKRSLFTHWVQGFHIDSQHVQYQLVFTHETDINDINIQVSIILTFSELSPLSICEYASSSLYIHTNRNTFAKDGERLKLIKTSPTYCYCTNNSVCMGTHSPIKAQHSSTWVLTDKYKSIH